MTDSPALRSQLVDHLKGGMAFLPVDRLIDKIPFSKLSLIPEDLPYSLWQQFWHMMYAQRDILVFSVDPDYKEPSWPDDYWPAGSGPSDSREWQQTVDAFFNDRDRIIRLIEDENTDLFAPLANDPSKNLLREVLLVIEHNAYHTGQILVIMREIGLHN